jgi:membrane-bound serine protease (ClpP class)
VRRFCILLTLVLAGLAAGGIAWAQPSPEPADAPVVDVAEIFGVLDGQLMEYAIQRVDDANRAGAALLVLEVDTPGALETDPTALVRSIERSRVPVAVWVGPRRARARSAGALIVTAAHIAAIGPSGRLGPLTPTELSVDPASPEGRRVRAADEALARSLASARGRGDPAAFLGRSLGANASLDAQAVDFITPSVAELLRLSDGRTVTTAAGTVTLRLRSDEVVVRFLKPGPVRGLLHTFANASLVYLLLLMAAMLIAFEAFQPGFGVAGVTGLVLLAAAVYGLTVLPVSILGLALFVGGIVLLGIDVAINGLGVPTIAGSALVAYGSLTMFPAPAGALGIPGWLVALGLLALGVFFVPVMTLVRCSRLDPEQQRAARSLIGQPGRVRSVLNPEGFVWVADALWRARSDDGERLRVGEDVLVTSVEGALLRVKRS